jgi:hypothetical protein
MLIIGGTFPEDQVCDSPDLFGTHNLNLGGNGPAKSQWDVFSPNITTYQVPPEIIANIGGGPSGGATLIRPQNNWDNRDLPVYFSRTPKFTPRMPTRTFPTATGSAKQDSGLTGGRRTAVIACTALGGFLVLTILLGLVLVVLHRRKKTQKRTTAPTILAELPTEGPHELYGGLKDQIRNVPGQHSITQAYFFSQESTQSTSPVISSNNVSSTSNPQQRYHTGPTTDYAKSTVYNGDFVSSSNHSQSPPGVYPLGPYYTEQQAPSETPASDKQLEDPANHFGHPSQRSQQHFPSVNGRPSQQSLQSECGDKERVRTISTSPA